MRVGSLFSGIGGLELGLERAGMRVVWQSEVDPFCCDVLARHWPDVPNLGDCRQIDWSEVERPDLVCGGFPCQPVSYAGKGRGAKDERWLWPELDRAVRALRPRYVLLENVPGLLARGMGEVLGDLAACGYDAEWDCIPAAAVGAPHLRDRLFIVAWPQQSGSMAHSGGGRGQDHELRAGRDESRFGGANVADSSCREGGEGGPCLSGPGQRQVPRSEVGRGTRGPGGGGRSARTLADTDRVGWEGRPRIFRPGGWPEPPNGGRWVPEPDVCRVAPRLPHRVDRLRALGNAVVPQVAEWIGRRIMTSEADPEDAQA